MTLLGGSKLNAVFKENFILESAMIFTGMQTFMEKNNNLTCSGNFNTIKM